MKLVDEEYDGIRRPEKKPLPFDDNGASRESIKFSDCVITKKEPPDLPISYMAGFADGKMAIEQLVERIKQPQWMPIETAPKDGTEILGWNVDKEIHEVVVWKKADYWCSNYYYLMSDGDSIHGYDLNITHWMPLPTPPASASPR